VGHTGRPSDIRTGLAVHSVALGLCSQANSKRKRSKSAPDTSAPTGTVVQLGPTATTYILHDNDDLETSLQILERILQEARHRELSWPNTSEEVSGFMVNVMAFGEAAHSAQAGGLGPPGSVSEHLAYHTKCFARGILLAVEDLCSGILDTLTMDDIATWIPGHTSWMAASGMHFAQARATFGISPILLSMWVDMVGEVDKDGQDLLLHSTDEQLLSIWHTYDAQKHGHHDRTDPLFALGPRDLVELLYAAP